MNFGYIFSLFSQVVVESKYSGRAYAETIIDEGNPVLADMQLSPTKEFIYVTTQAKVGAQSVPLYGMNFVISSSKSI